MEIYLFSFLNRHNLLTSESDSKYAPRAYRTLRPGHWRERERCNQVTLRVFSRRIIHCVILTPMPKRSVDLFMFIKHKNINPVFNFGEYND